MTSQYANHCAVLGLSGTVTAADVRAAYRREMLTWHPDRHQGRDAAAAAHVKAVAINAAYEFLSELAETATLSPPATPRARTYETYRTRHTYREKTYTTGFPDSSVFEVFVKSSNIVSAGYNPTMRILYLKFHGGSVYRYYDVPKAVFDELLSASSHGRYANRNICHSFRYERC